jgi:CDP-paratose 2-epimerase
MSTVLITGSAGLIGSEAAQFFAGLGCDVVGVDNDMRRVFFGDEASTAWQRRFLEKKLKHRYRHHDVDIRDGAAVEAVFKRYAPALKLVVHTAAQPSHDWAAREPHTDFGVNALGTLNLLEATRKHAPDAVFIFTSTNKVYGDTPNRLPLVELATRWELDPSHTYRDGIREDMSIDQTLHSLFGASKVAADVMAQEYGRYFGLKTGVFRGGCLTGPNHAGTKLHGFLSYLMKCAATGAAYQVFGYKGKQVRDNIHSADLIAAFYEFFQSPRAGEVYNIGGARHSHCSMLEAIALAEEITGREMQWGYAEENRTGDHVWWVSDVGKFKSHYPAWSHRYDLRRTLEEIYEANVERWAAKESKLRLVAAAGAAGSSSLTRVLDVLPEMPDAGEGAAAAASAQAQTKRNVLGVGVDAVEYDEAVSRVISAARERRPFAVSALAVHGVMTGVLDRAHRYRLNHLDLVVPDGQPVRWALNLMHGARLGERVYGPNLMLRVCERAADEGLPIYLYGSRAEVLARLADNLRERCPGLVVAGMRPSRFRQLTAEEKREVVEEIKASGAAITFVGLGCPRQEVWAYEHREALGMPLLAVGAAFDFHAGTLAQAPEAWQRRGFEWLFRLLHEPRRLWRRYVLLNPAYVSLVALQMLGVKKYRREDAVPPSRELNYG